MGNIISVLYILAFAGCGILTARPIFASDRPLKRILFGLTFGLVMLLWLPVLFAFILDFTLAAQILALAAAVFIAGVSTFFAVKKQKNGKIKYKAASKRDLVPLLVTIVPLVAVGWILHANHTITNASDGSLHVGQCTFGDLCMHLSFITSISVQKTFPPNYSLLPGTPLGYPFLCDSVSSTFYTLGASLRIAAMLPALYAFLVVVLGVYCFFDEWFKNTRVSVLATYLFFIGGGLGFAYLFNNKQLLAGEGINRWQEMLEGFYKTPTNLPAEGLRWVNSIADMLIPQRATLFGWALLFPALQLLHRAVMQREYKCIVPLGIIAGCMPLVHTHSFLAIGIISAFLFVAALGKMLMSGVSEKHEKLAVRNLGLFVCSAIVGALRMMNIRVVTEGLDDRFTIIAGTLTVVVSVVMLALALPKKNAKGERKGADDGLETELATELMPMSKVTERKYVSAVGIASAVGLAISSMLQEKASALGFVLPVFMIAATILLVVYNGKKAGRKPASDEVKHVRWFALFGVIAVVLAAPQLFGFTFKQSVNNDSFLRWGFNWCNVSDSWLWFYIKNLGLIFILMPVALLSEKKQNRLFYYGTLVIWLLCEVLIFQPNPYDNNKLLFVWFAFTCGIVANYLITTFARPVTRLERGKRRVLRGKTAGRYLLLAMMLIAMLLSGSLTLVREYVSGDHIAFAADADGKRSLQYIESGYEVVPAAQVELAEWINTNTDEPIAADATFLTESNHNNAVAMLTGRNIFCGSGSFLEYHGVNYRPRKELIKPMYEQPETCLLRYAAEYDIDYVLVGTRERGSYAVDTEWFNANLRVVYRNAQLTVYKIAK